MEISLSIVAVVWIDDEHWNQFILCSYFVYNENFVFNWYIECQRIRWNKSVQWLLYSSEWWNPFVSNFLSKAKQMPNYFQTRLLVCHWWCPLEKHCPRLIRSISLRSHFILISHSTLRIGDQVNDNRRYSISYNCTFSNILLTFQHKTSCQI